jgi:transposase
MSLNGMGQAMAFEGATDKEVFEAYMERFLAPTLLPGQVVVLDNLGAHKGERVRDLVEARGVAHAPPSPEPTTSSPTSQLHVI